ncbi:hypothetical protein CFP56_015073 [Quercus suber]|uniref:Uncharacterized protein n=1 Tax=Quercus suber TaxID=58331 RepID=A0AAW0KSM7_QUESU
MKFQGSPNDVVLNITKMAIITGEIVTRFRHWYILGLKKKNRGEGAYVKSVLAEKKSHNATLLPYFHHSLSGYGKIQFWEVEWYKHA